MTRLAMRKVAFGGLLAVMIAQPAARQAFGVQTRFLRDWSMMRGVGLDLIDARFYQVRDDAWQPLDRRRVLGQSGRLQDYRHLLTSGAEVAEAASILCELLGSGADVRAVTRQNHRYGWTPGRNGEENLCAD